MHYWKIHLCKKVFISKQNTIVVQDFKKKQVLCFSHPTFQQVTTARDEQRHRVVD
jgi:hypothetical protein